MKLSKLIKSCVKQNRKAQQQLYEMYKKPLFALCLKYCTNEAEAEDNLQDAFVEIFLNIKKYKGEGNFEGWMKRITINKAIQKFKSSISTKEIDAKMFPVVEDEIEPPPVSMDKLLELIQELPNQYRIVFNLFELDDYSHKEIAQMLSISEGTSKSNLHKAKVILQNKIIALQPKKYSNGI